MTMFEPNLQLRRIRVMNGALCVYEAKFHEGVNIICGQNASGKSTVIDFIFYALGGDGVPWKAEALQCTNVVAELCVNGHEVTVQRTVSDTLRSPMSIFWGNLDAASGARFSDWETYPYQRSQSKESFSQILFRALGLPELKGEGATNITMHQLMRLMYVDQRTPHDQIFRSESFDTILTRETVGNYLCGIYSDQLYEAQLELKGVEAKLDRSVSDLRNLFSVLGKTGQSGANTTDFLRAEAASFEEERTSLHAKLAELRVKGRTGEKKYQEIETINRLRSSLSNIQEKFSKATSQLSELEIEAEDSFRFIAELERRLTALDDSEETRKYLGAIKFNFCPCCLSKVEDVGGSACPLCKTGNLSQTATSQLLRMRNELALQRKESVKLSEIRQQKVTDLRNVIPALRQQLVKTEQEYSAASGEWVSPVEREIDEVNLRIGEISQKLVQLGEYLKLAQIIDGLQSQRTELEMRKSELQELIARIQTSQDEVKGRISKAIFDELISLLRNDLPRQEEFINAEVVGWSFGDNRVIVNGKTNFSESSMVILKHCFHMALLAASAKDPALRYPRFVLLDGIEDGGQEISRSHTLQHLIVKLSESLPSSHQIIFATSQIAPDLATNSLVIGKASTADDKTLAFHLS